MANFSAETQQLLVRVLADTSQAQSSIRQLQGAIKGLGAEGEAAAAASGAKAGQSYANAFNKGVGKNRLVDIGLAAGGGGLKFLQNTVLATAAAGAALEISFLRVQDAQAAMARTLEGESVPALAKLNQEMLELSKTIPVSVTELYRIGEVAGTIGITTDSIVHFTDVVAKMAATTDLGVDEAAMGIGRLLNIFGFVDEKGQAVADQADNIASAMVKLSISQASTDQEILLATERFGALATAMGLVPAQILAISSTAAALGQRPEAIGGSLQRIFGIFNKALGATGPKGKPIVTFQLEEMARVSGVTVKQLRRDWAANPFAAFTKFLEGFGKLTSQEQAQLFGSGQLFPSFVRGQQTLQGLSARVDLLKTGAAAAEAEYERGKLLDEQAAVRFNTIKNNLVLLGNAITRGAVAFGSAFDEELGGAIQRVTQYITDNQDKFEEWGRKVGQFIKSINWEQVKQFAQDFFGIFATGVAATGKVLDLLGPKLTGFLAIWATINKLSGGAILDVAKLLAGGIGGVIKLAFDQFVGKGSNPANPLWVAVTGSLGGIGGGLTIAGASIAAIAAGVGAVILSQLPKFTNGPPSGNTGRDILGLNSNPFGFLFPNPGASQNQSPGFGHGSDVGLGANLADAWKASEQANAAMLSAANIMGPAAHSLVTAAGILTEAGRKFLDSLKPTHRRGEVGKSIQTTEGRKLLGLDVTGEKFDAALADLVAHYTKEPIGSKGHPRSFVLGNINPIENRLGRELKQALKAGDGGRADDIVASLRSLDKIPKNDLPPWIRKLITRADANSESEKQKTKEVKSAVNTLADRTSGALGEVKRAIAGKRLSVRVGGPHINVRPAAVHTGAVNVRVSVGTRTITRVVRTQTAYGPNLVFQQPGQIYEGPN